ncbi:MAG: hypothetical protein KAH57_07760, partial [Thermoplasmata archaeon]|nr:hypothetical protein [Thermoplasmata archaeon]
MSPNNYIYYEFHALIGIVVMNMDENYVMPRALYMMSAPLIGGNNYALVISHGSHDEEVQNSELLRDELIANGWNVVYLGGAQATLDEVRNKLEDLKHVVGGERVLIYINDHSIITSLNDPPWGNYTLEDGKMDYSELDGHLGGIYGNFTVEKT